MNLTPVPRDHYSLGVPMAGHYEEVLNTDASSYGGSNVGNEGGVISCASAWMGLDHKIEITLPPWPRYDT